MAFGPYARLVLAGTIQGTQSWSIGFSVAVPGAMTPDQLPTWLAACVAPANTLISSSDVKSLWMPSTVYNTLRAYVYLGPGPAIFQAQLGVTQVVGIGGSPIGAQNALVCSLRSTTAGRTGRGRVYLPMTSDTEGDGATGQITLAHAAALATEVSTFITAINTNTIGGFPTVVGVASRQAGMTAPIHQVIVNTKTDTQRRRTHKIASVGQGNSFVA